MIKPYLYAAIAVALLGSITGAYVKGRADGRGAEAASRVTQEEQVRQVYEAAQRAAAEEIAKIKVTNAKQKTIIEREIVEKPVYSECRHSDDGLRAVNEALTNGGKPAGDSKLPAPDAP